MADIVRNNNPPTLPSRFDHIKFFIAGAEACLGEIGNGEEALNALHDVRDGWQRTRDINDRLVVNNHELITERGTLRTQIEELINKLNAAEAQLTNDVVPTGEVADAYNKGVNDGRAEAMQEHESRTRKSSSYTNMIGCGNVLVTMQAGHAPVPFAPIMVTTADALPYFYPEIKEEAELLIDLTVGIAGKNLLTNKMMFIWQYDSWCIMPREMKKHVVQKDGDPLAGVNNPWEVQKTD